MSGDFHSVTLDEEECKGCTNCIKRPPSKLLGCTGARRRSSRSVAATAGNIRCCPNHAKIAVTDSLEKLAAFDYRIVCLHRLFSDSFERRKISRKSRGFLRLGFDEVFEVALAAEVVSSMVKGYLETNKYKKPLISGACPAILRLMQMRFPDLLEQVAPIMTPMEVSARLAKQDAAERTGIPYDRIGAFFVSLPAKVTEVRQPLHVKKSAVDGVIGASVIYKDLIKQLCKIKGGKEGLHRASSRGMGWGYLTGESRAIGSPSTLSTGGIQNASVFSKR